MADSAAAELPAVIVDELGAALKDEFAPSVRLARNFILHRKIKGAIEPRLDDDGLVTAQRIGDPADGSRIIN